ncbi:hypothetical protein [Macrococcus capreoli]|uniref:hypothetical protein n=1 Tax=Macrococcus capreoli TaxID=2982690 RepID=UPI0021D5D003|nr:hypothetical protein [Macrococcus sp. TMW 2.2395]MCU7556557.1 hypothetical protein [Macrococcus sp. TMW 2.2395]
MRCILVTDNGCLASMTARNWARGRNIEIVDVNEVPSVITLYGVVKFPTLLTIGDYGLVNGRVDGFNEGKYNDVLNDI